MKGDLPINEPNAIKKWTDKNVYEKMLSGKAKTFCFQDGPPYANGNIHVGHALNKILKDIVVKFKNMNGESTVFIPGWDCHGLPIELGVSKDLGEKRKQITDKDFRNLCREYAMKWIHKQREQFIRLGILADWENPYMTLQAEYEAEEVRQLALLADSGNFYRGDKPVYWCWPLQTALADTEVEYHEHKSPAVYVKFKMDPSFYKNGSVSAVIWTTTPWTLPANLAIAVHPDFEYSIYKSSGELLLLADGLIEQMTATTQLQFEKVSGTTVKGSTLEGVSTTHPFIDRESKFVLGDHVTLEGGTGLVHTAPGHGPDDYIIGLKYGLATYSPVDEMGKFTAEVPEYKGINVFEANPLIVERLKNDGSLLFHYTLTHSYPHCWRTKKPLIYRATSQWFLRMDNPEKSIREKTLKAIKEVKWIPNWGENRINAMIENRPDWCLSRQRLWGVPIPVFTCNSCGEHLVSSSAMNRVADAMEAGDGINEYFESPAERFTTGEACAKCKGTSFEKSKDILDVWFDSGTSHSAVQRKRKGMKATADLYLEGSDQHRGWFQTSLLTSIAAHGVAPYKTVLTHGFVNDLQGRKMSKSLGNVVDPLDIIKRYGAEILRLWVSSGDYSQDLACGEEQFKRMSEAYRRIRNTMRFLLGNLFDYDHKKDAVAFKDMLELDQWALLRLNQLITDVNAHYEAYEFYKIYHAINNFITVDLSALYLDVLKDRLYVDKKDGLSRRSAQTVVFELTDHLCKMLAPILSFLSDEVYTHLQPEVESIFSLPFPKPNKDWKKDGILEKFELLNELRSKVSKDLEDLRRNKTIGASLEAKINIKTKGKTLEYLNAYKTELPTYFIVSQVEFSEGDEKIVAEKADGEKCVRCWRYDKIIGANKKLPGLCPRCTEALT